MFAQRKWYWLVCVLALYPSAKRRCLAGSDLMQTYNVNGNWFCNSMSTKCGSITLTPRPRPWTCFWIAKDSYISPMCDITCEPAKGSVAAIQEGRASTCKAPKKLRFPVCHRAGSRGEKLEWTTDSRSRKDRSYHGCPKMRCRRCRRVGDLSDMITLDSVAFNCGGGRNGKRLRGLPWVMIGRPT